ncbi:MAG TPA: hypothetical protein VHS74_12485 [Solirubrobacterales bacterium]|nr:hypothetical protein [Solirubrobacterales bacterium]
MSPLPANHRPEAVEWITASALRMLEDQQRRTESLQTRAGQVAGFAGAAVALGAPLGLKVTQGPQHLETLGAILYFAGAAALALTIVFAVLFVLKPVDFYALGEKEIGHYIEDPRFVTQTPAEIQFRTLKATRPAVARYESANASKAFWLRVSAYLFLAGLLLTVAVAAIIVVDRLCFSTTTTHLLTSPIPHLPRRSP